MTQQKPCSDSEATNDIEKVISILGRSGVAQAAKLANTQSVDNWRRRGSVPIEHCPKLVAAYNEAIERVLSDPPTLAGLNKFFSEHGA
ncbi:hypothetical protein [Zhongshania borealis]|uniref:Uncharacterized protein n=1 Tax=Zhongshania borealis TaxID=889488 RepID=A0ABP7WEG0_9GAMM|tara:strand:- start:43 stop:306 length:264 start_codon:yes stop_codon:yes gene_type:complete